jgi:translation initiation factor 1
MAPRERPATVYSSEQGRLCPHCGMPTKQCVCRANPRRQVANADGDGIARVGRTSKGRGGKTVTLLTGLQWLPDDLEALGRDLRRRCGSGGAVKDGVIEIQGDHRDVVMAELERRGIQARRTGG